MKPCFQLWGNRFNASNFEGGIFVKRKIFLLIFYVLFIKWVYADQDPSALLPGNAYTYDDSKDITVMDDLLGNGRKEKVVFYSVPPKSRNSFIAVVDLAANKVITNEKIPDEGGGCFVQQPSGIPGQNHTRIVKGEAKRLEVTFNGAPPGQSVDILYVDQERGSPLAAWRAMGSPQYIKPDQLKLLRQRAEIPPPETRTLDAQRRLALDLPPEGVALLELA